MVDVSALQGKHGGCVSCPRRPVASLSVQNFDQGVPMTTVSHGVSFGRQTVRRDVNARLRSVNGPTPLTSLEIFCECGRRACADRIRVALDLYEAVLGSPGQYVVATHHDHDPSQRLVSRHRGFLVVQRTAD
jgi:hypothetical protein